MRVVIVGLLKQWSGLLLRGGSKRLGRSWDYSSLGHHGAPLFTVAYRACAAFRTPEYARRQSSASTAQAAR